MANGSCPLYRAQRRREGSLEKKIANGGCLAYTLGVHMALLRSQLSHEDPAYADELSKLLASSWQEEGARMLLINQGRRAVAEAVEQAKTTETGKLFHGMAERSPPLRNTHISLSGGNPISLMELHALAVLHQFPVVLLSISRRQMGIYEPFDIKIMFPDNRLISDPITLETLSQFIGLGNDRALWLVLTREATDPRLWHAHPTFRWPAQSWLDLTEPPLYSKRLNEYEANSLRVLKRDCVRKTDFSLSEGADLLRSVFFYLSLSERAKISRTKEEEKKVGTKRKTPPSSMAFAAPKKTRDTLETKWLAKAFNVEKRLHQLSKPYLKDRCKDFWRPLLQRFEYSTQAVLRGFASPTEELKGVQGASTQQMPPTSAPQRHSQVFSVADSAQAMAPTYPAAESYLPTEGLKPEAVAPTWFPDEPYLPRGQPAHAAPMDTWFLEEPYLPRGQPASAAPMDTWFPEEPSLPLGQPANAAPMEMFRMVNGTVPSGMVEMHNSFPQEGEQPWEDPF
eukprot:scaffold11_cov257-Pinguiococcus_pyrenoidosus.AAC.68